MEVNIGPADAFLPVLFLFHFENMLVEEELKPLVCKVDAKLFEAVGLDGSEMLSGIHASTYLEILKPKDIQDADKERLIFAARSFVDVGHDPGEHSAVNRLRQSISGLVGLSRIQRCHKGLSSRDGFTADQTIRKSFHVNA